MHDGRLTDKEWEILHYFIGNEGYGPEGANTKGKKESDDRGYEPFLAYPAKIERDLSKGVTRGWAAKICADFERLGIFGHVMIRPPRQKHETEHYFFKSDLYTLRQVVRLVTRHVKTEDLHWIFSYRYFRRFVNEALVREVLREKSVEMWRIIEMDCWNDEDAERLYDVYVAREKSNGSADTYLPFDEYVRSMLRGREEDERCRTAPEISLRLPVFSDGVPKEERAATFLRLNDKELELYPFIRFESSGIESHYREWQYEKLILPILVLIQVSPGALAEFLCGDWKPYAPEVPSFKIEGTAMMEHTIFRLLFMAIGDLAMTRSIAGETEGPDLMARMAWLRKSNNLISDTDQDALFTVSMNNGRNIYYDGGFDTIHDFYRDDLEHGPDDEGDYWVKTWVGFDKDMSRGLLLREDDIKNPAMLVVRIRDRADFLAGHIMDHLSHEVRRLLELAEPGDHCSEWLQKAVLKGLNDLIMGQCIYDELAFKDVRLSEDTKKMLKRKLDTGPVGQTIDTFILNRALFFDAFPDILGSEENNFKLRRGG